MAAASPERDHRRGTGNTPRKAQADRAPLVGSACHSPVSTRGSEKDYNKGLADDDSSSEGGESISEVEHIRMYVRRRCGDKSRRRSLVHGTMVVTTCLSGIFIFQQNEHLGWLEAVYVITQVITTIGFGDITDERDGFRLFMSFYILWLLVLVAYFMNTVVQNLLMRQADHLKAQLRKAELHMMRAARQPHFDDDSDGVLKTRSDSLELRIKSRFGQLNSLIWATVLFVAHLTFGTVFYHLYEGCSCSYGHTRIEGCTEENACEVGETKNWIAAFYMSVVTLTTVGFGDITPSTMLGRTVGIPWMICGVLSTGLFVDALQTTFFDLEKHADLTEEKLSEGVLEKIDPTGKGSLSQVEFINFVLVKHGLVDQETVDRINDIWGKLDKNHDNSVCCEEVEIFRRSLAHAEH